MPFDPVVFGRVVGAVDHPFDVVRSEPGPHRVKDLLQGDALAPVPLVPVKGHELDETDPDALVGGPLHKVADLVVVRAADQYRVHLHVEAPVHQQADVANHLLVMVAPRDPLHAFRPQGVQAHVDIADPVSFEHVDEAVHQYAVGGDGELYGQLGQALDDLRRIVPHQRLATGQADLAHAHGNEGACDGKQFLLPHELLPGPKCDTLLGHAIEAPHVAALRKGDAQVVVPSSESICQQGAAVGHRPVSSRCGRTPPW